MICLDEMGPESAQSFLGQRLGRADPTGERRGRAPQEVDDGRRGAGDVFGAFVPATGEAVTVPSAGRTIANWVDFLEQMAEWIAGEGERVDAILANLSTQRALAVRLWTRAHPRWAVVCHPTSAADLHLIAPWWQVLRSLARKGRRCASWEAVCQAVVEGTRYWNHHRHPFGWGRRRRRQRARAAGIARLPIAA